MAIVRPDGSTETLASLSDFEAQNNPDAGNVYGILKNGACHNDFDALSKFLGPARYSGQIESNPYAVADDGYGTPSSLTLPVTTSSRCSGGQVSTVAVLPPIKQTLDKKTVRKQVRQINRKLEKRDKDPIPKKSLDSCIGVKYASNPVPDRRRDRT